jgi:hypothetical protein
MEKRFRAVIASMARNLASMPGTFLGVLLTRHLYADVPEVHMVDAVSFSEVAADLNGVLPDFSGHTAVEGDAVRFARDDFDQMLPTCERRHDLAGAAGGSLGCRASRTPDSSATGTTALRK